MKCRNIGYAHHRRRNQGGEGALDFEVKNFNSKFSSLRKVNWY